MEILARKPPGHANMLINHVKLISERGLDALYVSYEEMMDNLLPQLFRIQHFLGFEDAQSVERTFCTYLSKKEDEKIKRLLSQYTREAYGHKERKGHPQIA